MSIRLLSEINKKYNPVWVMNKGTQPVFDETKYQLITKYTDKYVGANELLVSYDWRIFWKFPILNKHRVTHYALLPITERI